MIEVASFYRFVDVDEPETLKNRLYEIQKRVAVSGYILVAKEGINGSIAGSSPQLSKWFRALSSDNRFHNLSHRLSYAKTPPFPEYKVRVRTGLVSAGVKVENVQKNQGLVVSPQNWNSLISREDIVLIDMRKDLEFELGRFEGSVNMATTSFRQFPAWAAEHLRPEQPVAMFCTGGIRCEKASAYLKEHGFSEVYQLQGGILGYLAEVPKDKQLWKGTCFVFDDRGAVDNDLMPVNIEICRACSYEVSPSDHNHPHYYRDAYCPRCYHRWNDEQRARFVSRARQSRVLKEPSLQN